MAVADADRMVRADRTAWRSNATFYRRARRDAAHTSRLFLRGLGGWWGFFTGFDGPPCRLGIALACLDALRAWPVTSAALAGRRMGAAASRSARSPQWRVTSRHYRRLPRGGCSAFAIFSRVVIGEWLVCERVLRAGNKALAIR